MDDATIIKEMQAIARAACAAPRSPVTGRESAAGRPAGSMRAGKRDAGNGKSGSAARDTTMKKTRRQVLKLFCLLPVAGLRPSPRPRTLDAMLGNEFVLLDGWVLKKTDLARLLQ